MSLEDSHKKNDIYRATEHGVLLFILFILLFTFLVF